MLDSDPLASALPKSSCPEKPLQDSVSECRELDDDLQLAREPLLEVSFAVALLSECCHFVTGTSA